MEREVFTLKVYLIRHGETDLNKKKVLQGRSDIELNQYGISLAEKTGEGLRDVKFDMVFTSPLKRAKKTAELVARTGETGVPVVEEPRIQEISFGVYEGLCYHKDNYNIPDRGFLHFFEAPEDYVAPAEGESFEEIIGRTGAFWNELVNSPQYADKTILLSTHGCALKAILANIMQTPIEKFWGVGVDKNCAVTIVEVTDDRVTVLEEGKVYY